MWVCTGPIAYDGDGPRGGTSRDFKAALDGVDVTDAFLPVVAPGERLLARATSTTRATRSSSSRSPTRCTRSTRAIVDAGFLLQVDDAVLAARVRLDPVARRLASRTTGAGRELRIDALNHALAGIPEERVRYHVCFGSWHGPHAYDPPLADVIDLVLAGARALLPDRAGEPPARARVAAVGGRRAARGQGARSRASSPTTRTSSSIRSSSPSASSGSRSSSAART